MLKKVFFYLHNLTNILSVDACEGTGPKKLSVWVFTASSINIRLLGGKLFADLLQIRLNFQIFYTN